MLRIQLRKQCAPTYSIWELARIKQTGRETIVPRPVALGIFEARLGKDELADPHATTALARVKGIDATRQIEFPHAFEFFVVFFRIKIISHIPEPIAPRHQRLGIIAPGMEMRCFNRQVRMLGGLDHLMDGRNVTTRENVLVDPGQDRIPPAA